MSKKMSSNEGPGRTVSYSMTGAEQRTTMMIFSLLQARAPGATICPSEVARALEPAQWRPLMPLVRAVARALAQEGRLELRQGGRQIAAGEDVRGPIRLALPTAPGARAHER